VAGLGLGAVALAYPPAVLGLSRRQLAARLLGGVALGVVLLLPAAVRWPEVSTPVAAAGPFVAIIAVGEELGFRGALYSALDAAFGPLVAVLGSAALFTAGHALTHPPQYLVAVAAAGVLLGAWRWACRDLVAPVIGHVIADVAI
jgi:membrane protease YdiL (CAAX protease family)